MFSSQIFVSLFFIELYRKAVWVLQERKTLTGILIYANVFMRNTEPVQFLYGIIQRINLKSEMAKSCRLWT